MRRYELLSPFAFLPADVTCRVCLPEPRTQAEVGKWCPVCRQNRVDNHPSKAIGLHYQLLMSVEERDKRVQTVRKSFARCIVVCSRSATQYRCVFTQNDPSSAAAFLNACEADSSMIVRAFTCLMSPLPSDRSASDMLISEITYSSAKENVRPHWISRDTSVTQA